MQVPKCHSSPVTRSSSPLVASTTMSEIESNSVGSVPNRALSYQVNLVRSAAHPASRSQKVGGRVD
jgi:hypothetical protein